MSGTNFNFKTENIVLDGLFPMTPELNNEIYYNCSKCASLIEILSLDEEKSIIEFKCLNKEKVHNEKIKMPLKEYLEMMKKYNKNKINDDECEIHKRKYVSYCFNCNCHLCEECLKTRKHLNHNKNNIIEIKPINEELNIIKEAINDYEIKIENLSKEKINKINELNKILNQNKNKEKRKIKENMIKNEKRKNDELKLNKDKYIEDINEIIKRYKKEINLRKNKFIIDDNDIFNKYKLLDEKENISHKYKMNELEKRYKDDIKNLEYDKQIENFKNIKQLNEILLNTYNTHENNYYNSININHILQSYIQNDYINKEKMKNILKNKYDKICDLILHSNNDNIKDDIAKEKEEKIQNEMMKEITEKLMHDKLKELNDKWKNKINNLKNKFEKELKDRENSNKKNIELIIDNISNASQQIFEQKLNDLDNNINEVIQKKIEEKLKCINDNQEYLKEPLNFCLNIQKEIKEELQNTNNRFINIIPNSIIGIDKTDNGDDTDTK